MNWVTFAGEGRSGHTILSGLLGSHPHAYITEEQKYISKWRRGLSATEIMDELNNAGGGKTRAEQGWQGLRTYTKPLKVIGDKCGWDAVNEFAKRGAPDTIFNDFGEFIGSPVKVIVTVRHPADNIASWDLGTKYQRVYPQSKDRQHRLIKRYRRFYKNVVEITKDADFLVVHHEELLSDPTQMIESLCEFLDLPSDTQWMNDCKKLLWKTPRSKRDQVDWNDTSKEELDWIIQNLPIMEYYRH